MIRLTNHQIAEAFGDTLSLIYREKIEELNADLQPTMNFLEVFNVPRFTDQDRAVALRIVRFIPWIDQRFKAIEHINKIRWLHKKMKREAKQVQDPERLNIEKARAVPITKIYDFGQKRDGKNVSCPLHEDRHPSASIKYNKLHCFKCGANMDGIALFMALNKVGFKEAVGALNRI